MSRLFWILAALLLLLSSGCVRRGADPVRVGVLYLRTGPLAANERAVIQATTFAVEELQAQGGLLGRPLEVVLSRESHSIEEFAEEAERLIAQEGVDVLFGCWTSTARKAVLPVLERHQHLLFYPLQYEGLEQSPYVVYTGSVPNQQLVPAVKWALDNFGKRVFLVGSDYVYPRIANQIARDQLKALRAEVVGEEYLPFGGDQVEPIVAAIAAARPDFVLNNVNGDSNIALFKALEKAAPDIPTMSTSLAERDFQEMGEALPVGHYATWSYFESLESPENRLFLSRYRRRHGGDKAVTAPMISAYISVHLWAQAAVTANSVEPAEVRKVIGGQSLAAPDGIVSIDPATQHTWKSIRVGRLTEDGQFSIEWSSAGPVRPRPFPPYQSREVWERKLQELYEEWDGAWVGETVP